MRLDEDDSLGAIHGLGDAAQPGLPGPGLLWEDRTAAATAHHASIAETRGAGEPRQCQPRTASTRLDRDRGSGFDCPKPSTTRDLVDSHQIRIIHPFHPLCGQSFRFVVSKKLWGEDRVTIQFADGSPLSVPVSWTDAIPADAYATVGGGRSRFRVEDLMALADLLALGGRR